MPNGPGPTSSGSGDAALDELRASFGDLAITAAERVIRRSLDRQAHEELITQVLEEGESLRRG